MRAFVRSAIVLALGACLALISYVGIVAVSLTWTGAHGDTEVVDAIVVMGAAQYDGVPSPLLASRLEHALDLWKQKQAPVIAVTGGKRAGDRFTEGDTSRRWLTDNGVPADAIIVESVGHSTWESLKNLAPMLNEANARSVVVVSSSWHVQRAALSLDELGFRASSSASASVSPEGVWSLLAEKTKLIREIAGVSLGRIIGFGILFDITG
ncbi:MAG: YdcF family protein [Ilumatobacteraceae bacterium]|nr:YdcF family protein [Ilumatobacteraceae bacterium]